MKSDKKKKLLPIFPNIEVVKKKPLASVLFTNFEIVSLYNVDCSTWDDFQNIVRIVLFLNICMKHLFRRFLRYLKDM